MFDCIKFIYFINILVLISLYFTILNIQTKYSVTINVYPITLYLLFDICFIVLIIITAQIILYWMSTMSC